MGNLTFRPFFINGQKTAKKVRLYIALTFRPFLATFSIFHKWAKKQKSKAIALTFRPFLATFSIFHKWAKNTKTTAIALTFRPFFINGQKTAKKVRL